MIGIGIVGCGNMGGSHARAIGAVAETKLVAGAEVAAERRERFTREFGVECHADLRALLERDDVDAVAIALPHDLHAEATVAALKAGKHVLCEKPMAMSVDECDGMLAAAARAHKKLMIGLTWHFFPTTLKMHDLAAAGEIGDPIFGQDSLVKNWGFAKREEWFKSRARGGGMLLANAVHQIDRLSWIMGDRVTGVHGLVGSFQHSQDADDMGMASLRFSKGGLGAIRCFGYARGGDDHRIEVWGTEGALRFDEGKLFRGRGDKWEPVETEQWTPLQREWRDFARCVIEDRPEPVDGGWGKYTLQVLLALEESSRTSAAVAVEAEPALLR